MKLTKQLLEQLVVEQMNEVENYPPHDDFDKAKFLEKLEQAHGTLIRARMIARVDGSSLIKHVEELRDVIKKLENMMDDLTIN